VADVTVHGAHATERYTKEQVNYRDESPEEDERCELCKHFEVLRKNGCEIVKGIIKASGYCDRFEAK